MRYRSSIDDEMTEEVFDEMQEFLPYGWRLVGVIVANEEDGQSKEIYDERFVEMEYEN